MELSGSRASVEPTHVDIRDAEKDLSRIIERVERGEEVIIA